MRVDQTRWVEDDGGQNSDILTAGPEDTHSDSPSSYLSVMSSLKNQEACCIAMASLLLASAMLFWGRRVKNSLYL